MTLRLQGGVAWSGAVPLPPSVVLIVVMGTVRSPVAGAEAYGRWGDRPAFAVLLYPCRRPDHCRRYCVYFDVFSSGFMIVQEHEAILRMGSG